VVEGFRLLPFLRRIPVDEVEPAQDSGRSAWTRFEDPRTARSRWHRTMLMSDGRVVTRCGIYVASAPIVAERDGGFVCQTCEISVRIGSAGYL
jgi:hypothetical protein